MSLDLFPDNEEGSRPHIEGGAVLLARYVRRSSLWTLPCAMRIVGLTLMTLCHYDRKPRKVYVDEVEDGGGISKKEILVHRGQFIGSVKGVAAEANVKRETCSSSLDALSRPGIDGTPFVSMKRYANRTLFTVHKFDFYNNLSNYKRKVSAEGGVTENGHGTGHPTGQGRGQGTGHEQVYKERKEGKSNNGSLFDQFWKAYPRRVGKQTAARAWVRSGAAEAFEKVMAALTHQSKSDQWTKDGAVFIPHPSTWLNHKRWEDDPGAYKVPKLGRPEGPKMTRFPIPPPGRIEELLRRQREAGQDHRTVEAARLSRVMRGEEKDE